MIRGASRYRSLLASILCLTATVACKTGAKGSTVAADEAKGGVQCQAAAGEELTGLTKTSVSCQSLLAAFPQVDDAANPEDRRVLCPFLRLLNRSRLMLTEIKKNLGTATSDDGGLPVSIAQVGTAAEQFGCEAKACAVIAKGVSAGQTGADAQAVGDHDLVNLAHLAQAKGAAHDCGFTFALGDSAVTDEVRDATLKDLRDRAHDDRLSYADLVATKKSRCFRDFRLSQQPGAAAVKNPLSKMNDNIDPDSHDQTEVNLIYAYLGGLEHGYVTYSDVFRLFNARVPAYKSRYLLDGAMLRQTAAFGQRYWGDQQ